MSQLAALIVDDNPYNLKILSALLAKHRIACTEVNNPNELPQMLPDLQTPDLAFIDLQMRGLDGYQVKALLQPYLKNTLVIAYTVYSNEMPLAQREGFDGFLSKPLDVKRFPQQLERILKGEPVWDLP